MAKCPRCGYTTWLGLTHQCPTTAQIPSVDTVDYSSALARVAALEQEVAVLELALERSVSDGCIVVGHPEFSVPRLAEQYKEKAREALAREKDGER